MTHADLSGLTEQGHPWNEIAVDGRGNAYLSKSRTGRLMTAQAPAPGAGWP